MTETETSWEDMLYADLKANGGRPSFGPLQGHPILVMTSTGRKSGEKRRSFLTYSREGGDYIVAGTNSGKPVAPAWVANIETDPNVHVEIGTDEFEATATVAEGPERDRLWQQHVSQLPWFKDYEEQIRGRTIPVARLRPSL